MEARKLGSSGSWLLVGSGRKAFFSLSTQVEGEGQGLGLEKDNDPSEPSQTNIYRATGTSD